MTDHDSRPDSLTGVLDALAQAVELARAVPMSSSVLVSRAEMLDLVDQARQALPTQLQRADEVLAEADEARAAAHRDADRIVEDAHHRAAELVDREVVVEQARDRARQIVEDAQAQVTELRRDADDYCDRRLADFEIDLGRVLGQVQAGRAKLAQRLDGEPEATEPPV